MQVQLERRYEVTFKDWLWEYTTAGSGYEVRVVAADRAAAIKVAKAYLRSLRDTWAGSRGDMSDAVTNADRALKGRVSAKLLGDEYYRVARGEAA